MASAVRNNLLSLAFRRHAALWYSTSIDRSFDVFDIFTDLLRRDVRFEKLVTGSSMKRSTVENSAYATSLGTRLTSDNAADILRSFLADGQSLALFDLLQRCDENIKVPSKVLRSVVVNFANIGLKDGVELIRQMSKKNDAISFEKNGEYLHHLAKCVWVMGNTNECLSILEKCANKYPDLQESTNTLLKFIIRDAVTNKGQAQVATVLEFVKHWTKEYNDYQPLTVLWNCLFLSEWFTDQQLAEQLLEQDEHLKQCIGLLCPSLVKYMFHLERISHIYTLQQLLLRQHMTNEYMIVLQIMFDSFRRKRDIKRCGEIVKTSVSLNTPLRDDQYDQFISWTVTGDPSKMLKPKQMKSICAKF